MWVCRRSCVWVFVRALLSSLVWFFTLLRIMLLGLFPFSPCRSAFCLFLWICCPVIWEIFVLLRVLWLFVHCTGAKTLTLISHLESASISLIASLFFSLSGADFLPLFLFLLQYFISFCSYLVLFHSMRALYTRCGNQTVERGEYTHTHPDYPIKFLLCSPCVCCNCVCVFVCVFIGQEGDALVKTFFPLNIL